MISTLGLDRQTVLEAVSKDPILSSTHNTDDNKSIHNLDHLLKLNNEILTQDETLTTQLDDLTKLKTFRDLVMEFNANLELDEFENCYYSLKSLRNKIKDYNFILLRQSFHFQRSLMKYIDAMHSRLIDNIYKLLFEKFWIIEENKSIEFNSTITVDSNELDYDSFILLIDQLFFSDSMDGGWFLNDMGICPEAENVRKKLLDIETTFINYDKLINIIKTNIFNPYIKFEYNTIQNVLQFNKMSEDDKVSNIIESFKCLTNFLNFVKAKTSMNTSTIIDPLGVIINNELLKFVRNNAPLLLYNNNNTDNSHIKDIKCIDDGLINLSKDCLNWHYTSHELDSLINDKSLYYNVLIDQNFNETVNEFRSLIHDNKNLFLQKNTVNVEVPSIEIMGNKQQVESTDNWDGWGEEDLKRDEPQQKEIKQAAINDPMEDDVEDDAWNDEIDLDLDELDQAVPEEKKEETPEALTEDHDAWDDEWDIDHDELENIDINSQKKRENVSFEITKLPEFIHNCIKSFENKCSDIQSQNEDYYNVKFESLQTVISIMLQSSYPENEWWQYYNDCKYSTMKDSNLTVISSSLQQFLTGLVIRHKMIIKQTINKQLNELKINENNPSWSPILDTLFPHVTKELFGPLSHIKHFTPEYQSILLDMIDFIYNKCIIDIILKWEIISEKNSENLGELITLVSQNVCIDSFEQQLRQQAPQQLQPHLIKYKQLREKFQLIGKFLPLHMKDIMEMFYNGDFYLFDTQEIVQWITLLFADTPLRQDAITDIYEIREAAIED
ncbi:protein transport protein Dsl1p [Monosporozyma servazzii]